MKENKRENAESSTEEINLPQLNLEKVIEDLGFGKF